MGEVKKKKYAVQNSIEPDEIGLSTNKPAASHPLPPATHWPFEGLLNVKQTAKILGISVKTVRHKVLHRLIPYVKLRGRVLFRPDQLWELIERSTVPAREDE
jgi:excisionase family DNA binding protein